MSIWRVEKGEGARTEKRRVSCARGMVCERDANALAARLDTCRRHTSIFSTWNLCLSSLA